MRILLETHLYLWWLQDHLQLSQAARARIMAATDVYVSNASIREAAIKVGIGKLDADIDQLVAEIDNSGPARAVTPIWRIMPACQNHHHPSCAPAAAVPLPAAAARSWPAKRSRPPLNN